MWLLGKTLPIEFGHAMGDFETFTAFENYRKVSFNIASEASYVYNRAMS